MSQLMERFFNSRKETIIKPDDENASSVCKILSKGLKKGNFIMRGGKPTKYIFNFDRIYG